MAASLVVISIGEAVSDAGLSAAIVARATTPRSLSSLYWTNIAAGAAICVLVVLGSPLIADFYDEPEVGTVVTISSLVFVLAPLGQQFEWLLERDLRFRPASLGRILGAVAGAITAIVAASLGAGVYSLVAGMLTMRALQSLVYFSVGVRKWRPLFHWSWQEVKPYLDFGLYQMGERGLNYAMANVDYALVGRYLGTATLGVYTVAYQLVIRPLLYINPILTRVAFPIFARQQSDNAALRRGYLHVVRLIVYVTLPIMLLLSVLSAEFIDVVLGSKWEESAPVLQVLCALGALRCLVNPVGAVLLAKNRPDIGFKGNLVALAMTLTALLIAVQAGILAVAWTSVGLTAVFVIGWLLVLRRLIGLGVREYVRAFALPVAIAGATAAVVALAREALVNSVTEAITLVACGLGGGLLYAGIVYLLDREYVIGLWTLFRRRQPAKGPVTG
jgi:O-antigen/teichoic acid export membrane protein